MVTMLSRLFDIENYFENYLSSQLESLSLSSLENTTHVMTVTRKNKSKRERERGNVRSIMCLLLFSFILIAYVL